MALLGNLLPEGPREGPSFFFLTPIAGGTVARRTFIVCNWDDAAPPTHGEPVHHNEWTGLDGKKRENDLCEKDQKAFLKAWETINQGADLLSAPTTPKIEPARRQRDRSGSGKAAQMRAWAVREGIEVPETGRISFTVEQQWKKAGSPNVLEDGDN
ncbi:histone-like nucleoid-structuring protein Lsr2 [Nonomuraea sp. NPDC050556]|uniref:Lsr2 dimerization domain-containing protein n=1 Tax=Nonomuraea sp. NPDC050556 TaxID=3364369 RepID=UPI0037B9A342